MDNNDGQVELLPSIVPQICIGDVVCNPSYDATGYNDQLQEPPNTNFCDEIGLSPELFRLEFTLSSEVNTKEVSDLMKKKLNSADCKPKRRELIDEIPIIRESAGLARKLLWREKVEKVVERESEKFKSKVKSKEEQNISRTDAIFEVYADYIVERNDKNVNKALLWIFTINSSQISEFCAELFVIIFLQRGADPLIKDEESLNTTLHYAARNGWTSVAKKLMEHKNIADVTNKNGQTPLEFAIEANNDECASFLIKSMEPINVRKLFKAPSCSIREDNVRKLFKAPSCSNREDIKCKLSFYGLLEKLNMQATVMAVLDTMIEPKNGQPGTYTVYYDILDSDREGHDPNSRLFNGAKKSCIYKIAKSENKEVVCHDVVQLLLMHKWKSFAKFRFLIKFILFIIHTVIMTSALVLGARKSDPRHYDTNVDILRGICEAALLICILWNIPRELYQLKRHKKDYFSDYFNYLDIGAILFVLMIIPFRIVNSPIQWCFASLGYLCQNLRGFEFAAVLKSTGLYVQILPKIVVRDIIPFGAVFSMFLFAFTGAFYFSLRGEEFTTAVVTSSNCSSSTDVGNCFQNTTTVESSSLNIFPHMTKEYYNVLFTNLRVMIEGDNVIDGYFGPNGYRWLSVVIYTVFLFLVIIVLLNLLIAQMSNTYTNVQSDAQRSLLINRAWIVAKSEDNSLFISAVLNCRKRKYIDFEEITNPQDQLEKWEAPPISDVCKELTKVHGLIIQQKAANERSLKQVNDQLRAVLQELTKLKEEVSNTYKEKI